MLSSSSFLIQFITTSLFFFFNDTATTEIYTLSLHDALPIFDVLACRSAGVRAGVRQRDHDLRALVVSKIIHQDRKSTRLNSSHGYISYAVFCLKKKKKKEYNFDNSRRHSTLL